MSTATLWTGWVRRAGGPWELIAHGDDEDAVRAAVRAWVEHKALRLVDVYVGQGTTPHGPRDVAGLMPRGRKRKGG